MLKKYKTSIINLIVSIPALILVFPLMISNYIFARNSSYGDYQNDGMIYSRPMMKYGGTAAPFDILLLKLQKISGTVRSKDSKNPVQGVKVRVTKPQIQTVSDESGCFAFELYNLVYDTFELEIRDGESDILLQTREVVFPAEKNIEESSDYNYNRFDKTQEKNFRVKEETLEIWI